MTRIQEAEDGADSDPHSPDTGPASLHIRVQRDAVASGQGGSSFPQLTSYTRPQPKMPRRKVLPDDYLRRRALWLPDPARYDTIMEQAAVLGAA
jgi:hypothetical protein